MTRPNTPPGPPYPDDEPREESQPRFTPIQPGPAHHSGPQPPLGQEHLAQTGRHTAAPQQYESGPQYAPPPGPQYVAAAQPPQEPPTQHLPPSAGYPPPPPPSPHSPQAPAPHALSGGTGGYDPYQPPPPAPRPQASGPSFTPHPPADQGPRHERSSGGKPRPTFTPNPNPSAARSRAAAPAPTAFFSPVPSGFPQPAFQPLDFGDMTEPRFVPADASAPTVVRDGETAVIDRITDDPARVATGPQRVTELTSPNLVRSSKVMALGTVASRGSGFLRTLVLAIALGQGTLFLAYNNANNLPNTVYYLMLGGIFTSVVVPMLVRASKEDPDRGQGYAKRIYSLGVVALLSITVLGTVFAAPIVDLYTGNVTAPGEHADMVLFAYFFIPQIFFYGMDSLLGAILNVRGRFGANMWTPVINNVVVIAVMLLFYLTNRHFNGNANDLSSASLHLLAIGTTLGIVIQSISLFPVMWRAGFDMKLVLDFRRHEIAEIGHMSGWMFGYVGSQALGNLVVQRVANSAANHANNASVGFSAWNTAYSLFQLPYAIVGITVISALLPRMSGHATERRYSLVRDDFSKGVRVASVIVVPAAVFLGLLGGPLAELLFAHGHTTTNEARFIGEVFGAFSIGLLPFMFTQLQLRVFYSFRENRTPAILGIIMLLVGVVGDIVALEALPPTHTVIGLAFAYDLVTLSGAIIAWPLLLRRIGSLDGWRITRSLVRMFLATVPGLVFILVITGVVGSFLHQGAGYGAVVTIVGGGGAVLLYAFCARLLGIEEYQTFVRAIAGRVGR